MTLRSLHIDFEALAEAMGNQGSDEYDYYLDTTSGRVMRVSTEVWNAIEEGRTIAGSLASWQQEELREAREIFGDTQGRYIPVPERAVWEIEERMTDFIDTLAETELRGRLTSAMNGRQALRRFRDILVHYPEERKRWLALEQESDRECATLWLADEEIEPVWISASTPQERA